MTYRPSTKIIKVVWFLTLLIAIAAAFAAYQYQFWWALLGLIVLYFPLRMQMRQLSTKLIIDAEHLVLEEGLLSKATRTLNIGKVQDVTVVQSISQRMLGVGDLRVETAGQGSAIIIHNFDSPRLIADQILKTAHSHPTGL